MRTAAFLFLLAFAIVSNAQGDAAQLRQEVDVHVWSGEQQDTAQAARYAQLTRAFINTGELDSAVITAQEGITLVQGVSEFKGNERPWLRQRMQAHKLLGIAEFYRGQYAKSLVAMQDYQRTAARLGSATDEGAAFNYMSYCFRSMHDNRQAERHARAAIRVLSMLPPDHDLANAYTGLSSVMADEDRLDSAQHFNRLAIAIYATVGNTANATNTWLNMADNWARIAAYDSCAIALEKARSGMAEAQPDAWMKFHAHNGRVLLADGAVKRAWLALDSAMHLAQELGSAEAVAHVGALQALTAAAAGRYREAIALQRQATDALLEDLDLEKNRALTEARLTFEHAQEIAAAEERIAQQRKQKNLVLLIGALITVLSLALLVLVVQTRRSRAVIRKERDRSDELLLNILPYEVAQELKEKGEAEARSIDEATIIFSDFMGFTGISELLSPQELVEELNVCFKAFDGIITARGIEKIKTIGDAYMAAGGLAAPSKSAPAEVVLAALEMQAFMRERKRIREDLGKPTFPMRVGIHTGPVVAGIVGVKKFQYDLWGDTVNIAARMESSGEAGQVNISESTFALVRRTPGLVFTPRGKVQAKGKGGLEMFFVHQAVT
ncbi:MAG: adenylate/guanylate cyclase domain-containing protein [Flavobacteriales bacterium]